MLTQLAFASAALLGVAAASSAQIVNGSFESPNQGFHSVLPGQAYGNWTCAGPNDIEFVQVTVAPGLPGLESSGYDGSYWIDLCGVGAASAIYQDVATAPGQAYEVSFAMAANVWGSPAIFHMAVLWNGVQVGVFSHDTTGRSGADMGWALHTVTVLGTGTDRLTFQALTGFGARGPAIDAVSMTPVPAPAAASLVSAAAVAGGVRRRRR